MARPKPTILLQQRIGQTDLEMLILKGEGYWTVLYNNEPINIAREHYYIDRKKYSNTGFAHEGHAVNLARKLNHQFDTDKFTVRKLL